MDPIGQPVLLSGTAPMVGEPLARLPITGAFDESWLQAVLDAYPGLLPVETIDDRLVPPLYSLGREFATAVGPIDNLFVSRNGYLVIVETKLWRNPEARRKVVAQVLDYASQVKKWTYSDLDAPWRGKHGRTTSLYEEVTPEAYDEQGWIDRVNHNLTAGRMALVIVGDGIRTELSSLAKAVGAQPDFQYRLALVELRMYKAGDHQLVIPVTIAKTIEVERAVVTITTHQGAPPQVTVTVPGGEDPPPGAGGFSEKELLDELRRQPHGDAMAFAAQKLLTLLKATDLQLEWRTAGVTIKAPEPSTGSLLSFGVIHKSGRVSAYQPWLRDQLLRAWGNSPGVDTVLMRQRELLAEVGFALSTSSLELITDLAKLAGREQAFAARLMALFTTVNATAAYAVEATTV